MRKGIFLFSLFVLFSTPVMAVNYVPKQFTNTNTGEGLYPYSLNNRRQQPQTTNRVSPIGGGITQMQQAGKRVVVKRPGRARAATTSSTPTANQTRRVVQRTNLGRSAVNTASTTRLNTNRTIDNRGVVARGASIQSQARSANTRRTTTSGETSGTVSSQKCFAGYKECMEMYCLREDTPYNRCYCSAKLAQIDSKYKNKIDSLIQEIIQLQNKTDISDSEEPLTPVEDYWQEMVSVHTGTNQWLNIDENINAVYENLNWADTETRVRGQNAFNIGHQYCVNHLRACAYMASNLRDAYKSEIARDCSAYENTLKKIKNIAESVIEHYEE